jgi:hypothetical protein
VTLEVYILCPKRTGAAAGAFLEAVMPHRESAEGEFPLPQFSDQPAELFNGPDEVIARLEDSPREPYSLHWNNQAEGEPYNCMLFFTEDGGMIAGVVVRDKRASEWLLKLASTVGGEYGYVTAEDPPPDTTAEFIERAKVRRVPALFEGKLRVP